MSSIYDSYGNINAKELKDLYKIEEVIGDRVLLKKNGKLLVGLCPFHKETNPSFTVYQESQSFSCYGCGIGGDLINFLIEFDKKSFQEVITDLARQKGIDPKPKSQNFPLSHKSPKSKAGAISRRPPSVPPSVSQTPTPEKEESQMVVNLLLNDNNEDFPKAEPISSDAWKYLLSSSDKKIPRDRALLSQIIYQYSPYQEVWRFEWPSPSKDGKNEKTFRYRSLSFESRAPKWGKGDDEDFIWAYRLEEIITKIKSLEDTENLYILHLEGEKSVEIARSSGISAFSIRGTKDEKLKALSTIPKSVGVVHIVDNDEPGRKHALELGELCEEVGLKFSAIATAQICPELTNIPKADIEEILNLICPGQFIAKISELLSSELPDLFVKSSKLEASEDNLQGVIPPVQQANSSPVPPAETLRLDILSYSDEVDPYRKILLKGDICARYRISTKALQELVDFTKGRTTATKAQRHTGTEFLKLETEGIKWLIPGIIPGRGVTILGGAPGAGKTTIAYDMAASILYQEPFLGEEISKPGKVLFVSSDEQPCFAQDKLINRGYTFDEQWQFVTDWDISQKEELELYISDFLPQFVMIDSFAAIHRDINFDENSSSAKAAVYWLESLANKYGCAIVLIHHCNKNREQKGVSKLRGNTAIAGACSAVLLLEGDNNVKSFSAAKLRGSEPFKW
ncbi:MAG: CHC2 zinc finger domain-containing protein, partial [Microcoleaceae cyanobacterium]